MQSTWGSSPNTADKISNQYFATQTIFKNCFVTNEHAHSRKRKAKDRYFHEMHLDDSFFLLTAFK